VKLKSLVVLAVLALACSAAFGQSFSLGFQSNDHSIQYCDYESVNVSAPYAVGVHNYINGCGYSVNAVMVGLKAAIPLSSGAPVTGAVIELADNSYAYIFGVPSCQLDWVTRTKANATRFGWSIYGTCNGTSDSLVNYGFLMNHLGPAKGGLGPVRTSSGGLRK